MRTLTETVAQCDPAAECIGLQGVACGKCLIAERPTREALEGEIAALKRENKGLRSALTVAQNTSRRGW